MLPAEELTLNVDALARLPSLLRKISSPLADRIHTICEGVRSVASGTSYRFPDFVGEYELDYEDAKAGFSKEPTRDREASGSLWYLSGKLVRVRMDLRGNTLLDYRNHLPEDFYPVVILDASGRVRTTYENWQKDRRNLVKLATADKSYTNLNIHVWNRGGANRLFGPILLILLKASLPPSTPSPMNSGWWFFTRRTSSASHPAGVSLT